MNKIKFVLLSLLLALTIIIPSCPHVHDQYCGYDEVTETGCTHEHTEECFIQPYGGIDPDNGGN